MKELESSTSLTLEGLGVEPRTMSSGQYSRLFGGKAMGADPGVLRFRVRPSAPQEGEN